jgi:hypothetical protein
LVVRFHPLSSHLCKSGVSRLIDAYLGVDQAGDRREVGGIVENEEKLGFWEGIKCAVLTDSDQPGVIYPAVSCWAKGIRPVVLRTGIVFILYGVEVVINTIEEISSPQ